MVLALFLATAVALAEEGEEAEATWGEGGELDTNYRYLWRGLYASDLPVLQPSAWLWWGDGTLSLWGSIPFPNDESAILELDPSLEWVFHAGPVGITPSVVGYIYPTDMASTTAEGVLTLDVPVGPVSIYTAHAFDFVAAPGAWFCSLGASIEQELPADLTVDGKVELTMADAAFNRWYWDTAVTGLDAVNMGVGIKWARGPFYIRPHGEFSAWFQEKAPTQLPYNVGLALGYDN